MENIVSGSTGEGKHTDKQTNHYLGVYGEYCILIHREGTTYRQTSKWERLENIVYGSTGEGQYTDKQTNRQTDKPVNGSVTRILYLDPQGQVNLQTNQSVRVYEEYYTNKYSTNHY